jgi:hypothetical protein
VFFLDLCCVMLVYPTTKVFFDAHGNEEIF